MKKRRKRRRVKPGRARTADPLTGLAFFSR
jgi:hypothetical protein